MSTDIPQIFLPTELVRVGPAPSTQRVELRRTTLRVVANKLYHQSHNTYGTSP